MTYGAVARRRLAPAIALLGLVAALVPVAEVMLVRWVDPPLTGFRLAWRVSCWSSGRPAGVRHRFLPLVRIDRDLVRAVVTAEDARFYRHHGFDAAEIRRAISEWERGGRLRGASTVTQQTARVLFLWPGRSWVRKALEAYYTVLLETFLSKDRILELYLNEVEWGPGLFGAAAAAREAFGRSAAELTPRQAALLAVVLPAPHHRSARRPGPYTRRLAGRLLARLAALRSKVAAGR